MGMVSGYQPKKFSKRCKVTMPKLLTGRWLIGHIVVLLALIILINLGLWQLRRLEQRRNLNATILAGLNAPLVVLTGEPVEPEALQRRRVSVTGWFDNEATIAIRNRPFQGQPGVRLVTPLRIKDSDRAVLVDRGWIPQENADPTLWSNYDVTGEVKIDGVAFAGQPYGRCRESVLFGHWRGGQPVCRLEAGHNGTD